MTDPNQRDPNAPRPAVETEPGDPERGATDPTKTKSGANTPAAEPVEPGQSAPSSTAATDEATPEVSATGASAASENAQPETAATAEDVEQPTPVPPPKSRSHTAETRSPGRGGGLLTVLVIVLLLLLALAAGAGYMGWQFFRQTEVALAESEQAQARQEDALAEQRRSLERLERDLAEYGQGQADVRQSMASVRERVQSTLGEVERTGSQIQQTQSQIQQTQSEIEQLQTNMAARLDAQQARINSLGDTSREDWMLAEAEYLLRLANQRVLLDRNPANAIALLNAADNIVREVAAGMGDPELFAIRKAIGQELTQLKLVPSLDREGTFLQLQALADTVTDLPRVPESRFDKTSPSDDLLDLDNQGEQPWYAQLWTALKEAGGALGQYVRIEDAEGPGEPLLGQREALLVATNVRLLLSQAQLALLREEPAIYQQSLEQTVQLVRNRFIETTERDAWIAELEAQLGKNISAPMPDISNSVKLLHGFIEKLHAVNDE